MQLPISKNQYYQMGKNRNNTSRKRRFEYLPLVVVVAVGFLLRLYGINWDQGWHFHPDERMLMIVAERISFFSNLNPDFFNYGSLPIYILSGVGAILEIVLKKPIANYQNLLYVGRNISVIADTFVIYLVYAIAKKILGKKEALLASFCYALMFFPIQNSHFFVVDVFLNLFSTLLALLLISYVQKSSLKKTIMISVVFSAILTTKFTGILFAPAIAFALILAVIQKNNKIIEISKHTAILLVLVPLFTFLFMPYGFIEYARFIDDVSLQLKMNSDPYIFPYTLQYVGTIPYWYHLKNIVFWGVGPFLALFSFVGIIAGCRKIVKIVQSRKKENIEVWIILTIMYGMYVAIVGKSSVKFMRYMLPVYPLIAIGAGYGISIIQKSLKTPEYKVLFKMAIVMPILFWTFAFMNIYMQEHTRLSATEWILKNAPSGSAIAVEHWDDRIPVSGIEQYQILELPMYETDTEEKWKSIGLTLEQADYIVLASNRLYGPIQRLDNCSKYKRCFPISSLFYKDLFEERTEFSKVVEFLVQPGLKIGSRFIPIRDQSADESFTVYDHPKVMIFEKKQEYNYTTE